MVGKQEPSLLAGGKFYGIGVGPGDPELLTLKAYRTLERVEVLCVPKSSTDKESLALAVVSKVLPREFVQLELHFPMSRDHSVLQRSWAEAGEKVAGEVMAGRQVAFLTIGDPMLYSTYGYVLRYLKKNYPSLETETIPGVVAFSACAAYQQVPLVVGEESLAVVPAVYGVEKLRDILLCFDSVVLMKVNRCFPLVFALLRELGLEKRAVYVSRCGYPDQYITGDLESLLDRDLDYMSMIIVRKAGES